MIERNIRPFILVVFSLILLSLTPSNTLNRSLDVTYTIENKDVEVVVKKNVGNCDAVLFNADHRYSLWGQASKFRFKNVKEGVYTLLIHDENQNHYTASVTIK